MLESNAFRHMKNKRNQDGISAIELEKKNAIRIDAILSVTIDAITSLVKTNPVQAAASISYYSLFSLFPMLLFMVVVLSYFLEITVIQQEIILILEKILPGSETLVIENMQNILSSRFTTSITAAITLLWSGSGVFNCIIYNIHLAWPESRGRGYFINRAFAISAIIVICFLLAATLIFTMLFNLSDSMLVFDIRVNKIIRFLISFATSYLLPTVLVYFAAFVLFYYVPSVRVDRIGARIGALLTAVVWRVFTYLFSIYILSPFNTYDVIYGSVAMIILILFYVYVSALFILFSAHLVASITHYKNKQAERAKKAGDTITVVQPVPLNTVPASMKKNRQKIKLIRFQQKGNMNQRLRKLNKDFLKSSNHIPLANSDLMKNIAKLEKNETFMRIRVSAKKIIYYLFRWK